MKIASRNTILHTEWMFLVKFTLTTKNIEEIHGWDNLIFSCKSLSKVKLLIIHSIALWSSRFYTQLMGVYCISAMSCFAILAFIADKLIGIRKINKACKRLVQDRNETWRYPEGRASFAAPEQGDRLVLTACRLGEPFKQPSNPTGRFWSILLWIFTLSLAKRVVKFCNGKERIWNYRNKSSDYSLLQWADAIALRTSKFASLLRLLLCARLLILFV